MIITFVLLSVVLVVAIGMFVARRVEGDRTSFLVAGRGMALPLVAAGLMGQAVDTNATLGNTDLSAIGGFWAGYSLPLGLAVCLLLTGIFLAPRMNKAILFTLPDAFGRRYGRGVEGVTAVLLVLAFTILIGGNLVAGGFLFEQFLGTPYWVGVVLIVVAVLAYTAAGGMLSDAYTALVQMIITVTASFCLLLWLILGPGISVPEGMGPFDLEQLGSADSGAVLNWATLISLGIGDIVAIDFMQRIFTARSPGTARRACFVAATACALVGIPYSLLAVSSPEILGGPADGPVLFAVLETVTPVWLTVLVLCGIVAAGMSTANGAILGSAAVLVRNVAGRRSADEEDAGPGGVEVLVATRGAGVDPVVRATRWCMLPVVAAAILLALEVPETGVLLVLAFDLMLASLVVPFLFGVWWSRGTKAAALAGMIVGFVVRLVLFALTPTFYGAENTLFHVDNGLVGPGFDGWPTFIAPVACLVVYVAVCAATHRHVTGATIERAAPVREPEPAV
jgi:SSS family solute:Na+ symporter